MKKLINISVDEVSVVDKPANDRKFLIIKHAKGGEQNMTIEEILEKIEDEELKKGLSDVLDDKISKIKNLEEKVEELEKAEGEEEGEEEGEIEKVDLPEEVAKSIEALEKRVEVAESMAKKEHSKRMEIEFTKRAEDFKKVAEVDKIVSILMKANEVGDDFYNDLEDVLKTAQARIEEGNIEKINGKDGGGDATDPLAKIEELADAIVEKGDMTREKAIVKVLEEHPELYREYIYAPDKDDE